VVALVGLTVFRAMFPETRGPVALGVQRERLEGARVFVLPNPSGRNANFSHMEMLSAFVALRRYLTRPARVASTRTSAPRRPVRRRRPRTP
jgi:TDG/mug DNA glycosylase family protein